MTTTDKDLVALAARAIAALKWRTNTSPTTRREAQAVLDAVTLPLQREAEARGRREAIDQLSTVASDWEPMLHVEEILVGDNYGSPVNLSLWIWIEEQGKKILDATAQLEAPMKRERSKISGDTLSEDNYDDVVEGWNKLNSPQRKELAEQCRTEGHRLKFTPFSDETNRVKVCTRCCSYFNQDKK